MCFLIAEVALIVSASAWTLVRLSALRRRTGAYGLDDALGAGSIAGVVGFAAGGAICVLSDVGMHPSGGWLGLAGRCLAFGGLALIEGAVVGVAMAFVLVRFSPGPAAQPPEDRDPAA